MVSKMIEEKLVRANGVHGFYLARSIGDSVEVYSERTGKTIKTFHFLRNQELKEPGVPNLCLADFIAPAGSGIKDYMGLFVVTAGIGLERSVQEFELENDDYYAIMLKILTDRFAEAYAELLHKNVRRILWAYHWEEMLDDEEILEEKYRGIRPAPGYPACPEHSEKKVIFDLLNPEKLSISLTENFAMYPAASVSGFYFAHPEARYFNVGKIGYDQVQDYAMRKNISVADAEKLLAQNLNY
jgi:5-methyltetrahydrofolate--homocysteine methyltransferase